MKERRTKHPGVFWRGGWLWIDYRDPSGRRHKEPAKTRDLKEAIKFRARRLTEAQDGKSGPNRRKPRIILRDFIVKKWHEEVEPNLAPSTRKGYDTAIDHDILPAFGDYTLEELEANGRALVTAWKAAEAKKQRFDYSEGKNPNPARPLRAPKTLLNSVSVLSSVLDSAVEDFGYIDTNPLHITGSRRRRRFPTEKHRPRRRVRVLEPVDFRRALAAVRHLRVALMILFAAGRVLCWWAVAIRFWHLAFDDERS